MFRPDTAVKGPNGHDRRVLRDVEVPRHDGLESGNDLGAGHDGVDPRPRRRAVGLPATEPDAVVLDTGQERTGAVSDGAHVLLRGDVQPEDGVDVRIGEGALPRS